MEKRNLIGSPSFHGKNSTRSSSIDKKGEEGRYGGGSALRRIPITSCSALAVSHGAEKKKRKINESYSFPSEQHSKTFFSPVFDSLHFPVSAS